MSNGRCRIHGGASLRGAQHPNAKTLEHSKYLPERLAARYDQLEHDVDLLTLRREIKLIRTRLSELLQRIDEEPGSGSIDKIEDGYLALKAAMAAQDRLATERAWSDLGASIRAAKTDFAVWNDINQTISLLTRTTESERKRLVEAEYMVKMDEVMNFVAAVAGIVRETIKDRETINTITGRIQRLLEANYGHRE
jgi:hypothetical protein